MTFDERVQAVARKGFTERQARFLTTVMLHAGVCVQRQYARFCDIVHGQKDAHVLRQARGFAIRVDVRLPPHLSYRALDQTWRLTADQRVAEHSL